MSTNYVNKEYLIKNFQNFADKLKTIYQKQENVEFHVVDSYSKLASNPKVSMVSYVINDETVGTDIKKKGFYYYDIKEATPKWTYIEISGGSGTTNYNALLNKPSINGVELRGNKTLADLGITNYDDTQIKTDITDLDTNKQDKTDNALDTTDKTVVGAINEINDSLLDNVTFSADYKNIIINRKNGLNPYTIPIASIIHNAKITELNDIDTTNIGDGKTLVYDGTTQKHKYVSSTGTDELVKMDSTTDAKHLSDLIDKQTIVNDGGVLKVKKLDGQNVTIAEINYLKGLTMNVMDLVNAFANGGVKVLNTPVNTYADLSKLDRSTFLDGISYIVYVLADETHSGAKTTYLCNKTSETFFGNADSQRNFITNPIDLANEVTGKLGTVNIDVDALWKLLTINDTYKTLTTKNEPFGTHGAKALYDELVTSIGKKANTTDLTTHTSDTNIHVTTSDKTKWNKVDDKADKTDLTTHTSNTNIHITTAERDKWNEADDKIKALKTSQNLEYKGESVICNNTLASRTSDMFIKGKTYINLGTGGLESAGEKENKISISSNNNKLVDDVNYKEYKKEILLPIEDGLKSLPNEVGDTIEQRNDGVYLVQRVGKYDIKENDEIEIDSPPNQNNTIAFAVNVSATNIKTVGDNICNNFNHFASGDLYWNSDKEGILNSSNSQFKFRILKSKLSTQDIAGIKAWLKANPTTVYYEFKAPTETKLDINNLDLEVYEGTTYITTDNTIQPTLSFKVPSNMGGVIHGNSQNINKLYKLIDEGVNKTDIDITTTIDSSSTDTQVPSAKAVYDELDNKVDKTDLTTHTSNTNIHITTAERDKWNKKANATDLTSHISNTNIHITSSERTAWNNKANATDLTSHTGDTNIHVTTSERTKWNKVDNKVNKTDIVDNLTSTNTDKPLSAKQGKVLKDEIGLKANTTDLTTHTSNTGIHITTAERTKWNKVDNKVDKTDITTTIDSTSTDTKVPSAKSVYNNIIKDKLGNLGIDNTYLQSDSMNVKLTHFGAYKFGNPTKGVPSDNVGDWVLINIPWQINDKSNFTTTMQYANQLLFSPRKDNVFWYRIVWNYNESSYTYTEGDYNVFRKWNKICMTSVTDVPKTNIAPADETKFIGFKGNSMCNYCVVNGVCYVTLWNVKVSVTGRSITGVMLPMPKSGSFGGGFLTGGGDAEPHAYAHIIPETGELKFNVKDANTALYGSFSYLVSES